MTETLSRTASVVLGAGGTGALTFGPSKYAEKWQINRFTTEGNSTANPTLQVFRGTAGGDLLDTTYRGNADVSETTLTLNAGEFITAVYSGGTAGALMEFHLEGAISRGI